MSGAMFVLSPADEGLLRALATYRFLTIMQAVRLGIGGREHIGERLRRLAKAGYVSMFGNSPLHGPRIHWLTKRGADAVRELLSEEGAPAEVPAPRAYRGGAHLRARVAIVDCHIALAMWAREAGLRLDDVRTEFSRNPATLAPATTLTHDGRTYTPDGIFQLTDPAGKSWLLVLELERGGFAGSPDHFRRMMAERAEVINTFTVEQALDWQGDNAARFLFVFATSEMMEAATRRLPEVGAAFWKSVYFKSLPEVIEAFPTSWHRADGTFAHIP